MANLNVLHTMDTPVPVFLMGEGNIAWLLKAVSICLIPYPEQLQLLQLSVRAVIAFAIECQLSVWYSLHCDPGILVVVVVADSST